MRPPLRLYLRILASPPPFTAPFSTESASLLSTSSTFETASSKYFSMLPKQAFCPSLKTRPSTFMPKWLSTVWLDDEIVTTPKAFRLVCRSVPTAPWWSRIACSVWLRLSARLVRRGILLTGRRSVARCTWRTVQCARRPTCVHNVWIVFTCQRQVHACNVRAQLRTVFVVRMLHSASNALRATVH